MFEGRPASCCCEAELAERTFIYLHASLFYCDSTRSEMRTPLAVTEEEEEVYEAEEEEEEAQ